MRTTTEHAIAASHLVIVVSVTRPPLTSRLWHADLLTAKQGKEAATQQVKYFMLSNSNYEQ
jgi:hypothetical protein